MSTFDKRFKNFAQHTKDSTLAVGTTLLPNLTPSNPGFYKLEPTTAMSLSADHDKTELELETGKYEFQFLPLYGEAPWTMRLTPPSESTVDEITHELENVEKLTQDLLDADTYTLSIEDNTGTLVPLNKVLYRDYTQTGGYWESSKLHLSPLLLNVEDVNLYRKLTRLEKLANYFGANLRPQASGWTVEYIGVSGTKDVTAWSTVLPTAETIFRKGITGFRLKLTSPDTLDLKNALAEVEIIYTEDYATEPPNNMAQNRENNLYIPKLRVLLDSVMDVSKFVASFNNGSVEFVVPDTRIDSYLMRNPRIRVTLDENLAFEGRISSIKKQAFATGVRYQCTCTSLFDLLGGKMDEDILVNDVDADGKLELGFNDDGGYIAYVTQTMPGVGVRPLIYENRGFRPMEAWFQGDGTNTTRRIVQLDADYDWYQIYATQNQTVRGKLKEVANANLYEFTSVAGHPALVPMVASPDKTLPNLTDTLFNQTATGTYLPESRLYVPEYTLDTAALPKGLEVRGLESIAGREDTLFTEPQPIYWKHDTDGTKHVFRVEAAGSSTGWVDFYFVDEAGFEAAYQRGSVEVVRKKVKTDFDMNIWKDVSGDYEFIDSDDDPNYLPGYDGIIGLRMKVDGGVFVAGYMEMELDGKLLYSASGERGEPPLSTAEGTFMPAWAKTPQNFVTEMKDYSHVLPKDKESAENHFVTTYWLPTTDTEMNTWNQELIDAGKPIAYYKDANGYYVKVRGYELHERHMSELADALALQRVLNVLTIDLKYIGHIGLKHGEVFGVARRPAAGVHGKVEKVDYFMVLEDFQVAFSAGGNVTTSMRCGYIGTVSIAADGTETVTRSAENVTWQEPKPPIDDALFF